MPDIGPDTRWMLAAPGRPSVYPFRSEDAAQEWADEHGLIDHAPRPIADAPEHEAICGRCREPWPCHHEQVEYEARKIVSIAEHTCARCKKYIGGMRITVQGAGDFGSDVHYHGRKGACENAAKREAERVGDERALDQIARNNEYREEYRQWRENRKVSAA